MAVLYNEGPTQSANPTFVSYDNLGRKYRDYAHNGSRALGKLGQRATENQGAAVRGYLSSHRATWRDDAGLRYGMAGLAIRAPYRPGLHQRRCHQGWRSNKH